MSLAGTIRSAVATADKVVKSLQPSVQHACWTGQDMFGKATFSSFATRKAIIEQGIKERRLGDGRIVMTSAKITFLVVSPPNGATGRVEPIDPRDKLVLPDGTSGPILDVSGLQDAEKNRPYLLEVSLGL